MSGPLVSHAFPESGPIQALIGAHIVAGMVSELVLVNQMWPRQLKLQMTELAARQGVSVAELTRRAVQAQYAAELGGDDAV